MSNLRSNRGRKRRLIQRAVPLVALAIVAFAAGAAVGDRPSAATRAAIAYTAALAEQDFAELHTLLNPASQALIAGEELAAAYEQTRQVATIKTIATSEPGDTRSLGSATIVPVPLTLVTVAYGTIEAPLELTYDEDGIEWSERLLFPGLSDGETLEGSTALPERASILTADGVALAEGPALARSSPLGSAAIDVAGTVGEPDPEQAEQLQELGLPPDTPVGLNGLEKAFDTKLRGQPGGVLNAVDASGQARALAQSQPQPGD